MGKRKLKFKTKKIRVELICVSAPPYAKGMPAEKFKKKKNENIVVNIDVKKILIIFKSKLIYTFFSLTLTLSKFITDTTLFVNIMLFTVTVKLSFPPG